LKKTTRPQRKKRKKKGKEEKRERRKKNSKTSPQHHAALLMTQNLNGASRENWPDARVKESLPHGCSPSPHASHPPM
jgi:hypothetical protein